MKKLPQVFAAIILSHFVLKIARKLKQPDQVSKVDARPMRNYQRAALSSIPQSNLNLMESLEK